MVSRYGRGDSDLSGASEQSAAKMDEAFRRVGHRLSQRVGGDDSSTAATVDSLGDHPLSAFHPPLNDGTIRNHAEVGYDRTAKVAKMEYSDHGTHRMQTVTGNVLKNLTIHSKETYTSMMQEEKLPQAGKKRISPTDSISPHRQALSDLELEDKVSSSGPKGLLQAALDVGTSSNSSSSTAPINNSVPVRGKCLTVPSDPVSNDGLDNADGNIIVHENDRIAVPARQVHTLSQGRNRFRVISMLGQGTFAQVFKCQCLQTGDIVAVKIVKNKPAYTRQAAVEVDVFTALSDVQKENMVRLQCYFMYHHHLCLVFELLGVNLYEVLKKRQFRGLPLPIVRSLVQQTLDAVKDLSQKNIVHCDLKPENILLSNPEDLDSIVRGESRRSSSMETASSADAMSTLGGTPSTDDTGRTSSEASSHIDHSLHRIKLIDFGSACFEGHASHTYIQSRFYRSPEVLIGVPYDAAIDMWSMGCVAAELFLGLPILPGVHEHDQLGRIAEMIGPLPDRMLDHGSKSNKYFVKQFMKQPDLQAKSSTDLPPRTPSPGSGSPAPLKTTWRLKTRQEYVQSLSASEIQKKGGMEKLQKQQTNRYFKCKKLADIVMLHGHTSSNDDRESLGLFAHFLMGILDPDPLKRWTAYQASMHPFLTGRPHRRRSGTAELHIREFDICWTPPFDPAICRRKLADVQRIRDKQRALRRSSSGGNPPPSLSGGKSLDAATDELSPLRREQRLAAIGRVSRPSPSLESIPLNQQGIPQTLSNSRGAQISPLSSIGTSLSYQNYANLPQDRLPANFVSMNVSDGRMNSLPQSMYATSFSEYNAAVAVDQRLALSTAMLSGSYADGSSGHPIWGPQSFSAVYEDNFHQLPVEADFGYALQRPGVVPSMDSALSGSSNIYQTHPMVGAPYSPQNLQTLHQRARSFTYSSHGGGASYAHGRRLSHGPMELVLPGNQGLSQYMISQGMVASTSIKEDATDFVLGSGCGGSMETRSSGNGSLLAQQLEGRPAGAMADSYQEGMISQAPAYLGQAPAAVAGLAYPPSVHYAPNVGMLSSGDSAGYYYTTYVTPNGAVMSAPVNMDMHSAAAMPMHSFGSPYGYAEQRIYAPPNSLHAQVYPSANLSQPSYENANQSARAQRKHAPRYDNQSSM